MTPASADLEVRRRARKQGIDAHLERTAITDNPYPPSSAAHFEWRRGWAATEASKNETPEDQWEECEHCGYRVQPQARFCSGRCYDLHHPADDATRARVRVELLRFYWVRRAW